MTDSTRKEPEGFEPFERTAPSLSDAESPRNMAKNDPTQSAGWERATLEKLAFASLREQRAARRWKTFVRLAWLAFFIALVWFAVTRATPSLTTTPATRDFPSSLVRLWHRHRSVSSCRASSPMATTCLMQCPMIAAATRRSLTGWWSSVKRAAWAKSSNPLPDPTTPSCCCRPARAAPPCCGTWQCAPRRTLGACAVFYVSDFDPSGRQMPISAARKLQAMHDLKLRNLRIEVHHVCLTRDQVIEYDLPSTPLKETERRADKWRRIMGHEQTEVDALQALRPDILRQIVTAALEPFYDHTLDERLEAAEEEWRRICRRTLRQHPAYVTWRARIAQAMQEVEAAMEPIRAAMGPVEAAAEIAKVLQAQANDELRGIEFPPFELPMPMLNMEDSPEPLFSTSDDYVTATAKLKAYKSMDGEGEED